MNLQKAIIRFSFLAATALTVGCGPSWVVVRQANPNPFVGQKSFAAEPATFNNLQVGKLSEADWVAKTSADKKADAEKWRDGYEKDKQAMAQLLSTRLAEGKGKLGIDVAPAGQGAAQFVIKPNIFFIEPGIYTYFVNLPTVVQLDAQLVDDKGMVLDEVQFKSTVQAGTFNPSVGQRLRQAANSLGDQVLKYLHSRSLASK